MARDASRSRLFWISPCVGCHCRVAAALTSRATSSGFSPSPIYFGVFAMAWDLLFGFAGEVNFGPTFLIGLGAYTAGILNDQLRLCRSISASSLGALAAVIGGVVLALPALRVRGPYFGLTTLVAVLMLQNFIVVFAGSHRRRDRPDRSRCASSINADTNYWIALGLHDRQCGIILYGAVALAGRPRPAGERAGPVAGRRARLQCRRSTSSPPSSSAHSSPASPARCWSSTSARRRSARCVDVAVGVQVIIAAVLGGRRTVLGAALGAIFLIVAGEFAAAARRARDLHRLGGRAARRPVLPGGLLGILSREAREWTHA